MDGQCPPRRPCSQPSHHIDRSAPAATKADCSLEKNYIWLGFKCNLLSKQNIYYRLGHTIKAGRDI